MPLLDPLARVKVVRKINYCGGPGMNIAGCAWRPGNGIVMIRLDSAREEGSVMLHEFGHNAGLVHNPSPRFIMYRQTKQINHPISIKWMNCCSNIQHKPLSWPVTCKFCRGRSAAATQAR